MKDNERVKKVLALLSLIDDTQEQVQRIKDDIKSKIKALNQELETNTTGLQATLNQQYSILGEMVGVRHDSDYDVWDDRNSSLARNARPNRQTRPTPPGQIKEAALLYIGRELAYPTPEAEGENSGQTLPNID